MYLNSLEIKKKSKNKKIVFWGCSEDWVPKSKSLLPKVNLITDQKFKKFKDNFMNLRLIDPNEIIKNKKKYYIVVTSGSVDSVSSYLINNGFNVGNDFCFSPVFESFKDIENFNNISCKLIFSCSDYGKDYRSSQLGGGVYEMIINSNIFKVKKIFKGSYRQLKKYKNLLYAIESLKNQIVIFDLNDLKRLSSINLISNHYTGIEVYKDNIFTICTSKDVIEIYSLSKKCFIKSISFGLFSDKQSSPYHLNDCHVHDEKLFFSYFSKSGQWRNEIFDGGISYLCLKTYKIFHSIDNLKQPHSLNFFENDLHFCESMTGKLFKGSYHYYTKFNGFIRGLDANDKFYFIGQSETLYSKRMLTMENISINSGIHILSRTKKLTKFYPTFGIKNIHSVINYEK